MARGKTGVWLVGAGLLASWAVSSASDGPPALPAAPAPEAPQSAAARAMAAEIGRLQSREVMPARVRPASGRDPFAFETVREPSRLMGGRDAAREALTGQVEPPMMPEAPVMPMPSLVGLAAMPGKGAVAVIAIDGVLHYASRGDVIANRYRVDEIVDRGVALFDLTSGTKSRLILQRP